MSALFGYFVRNVVVLPADDRIEPLIATGGRMG